MSLAIAGAAALAAAVLLLGFVLATRLRRAPPIDAAEAAQAAGATLPGFVPRAALLGDDRRSALVIGEHGRVALATSAKRGPVARETRWRDIRAVATGMQVELGRRAVLIAGVDVLELRRAGGDALKVGG